QLRSKQSLALDKGAEMSATEWLLELISKSDVADTRKVFRIDHPELLGMMKLSATEKNFSFNDITPSLDEIEKQARRIRGTQEVPGIDEKLRTPFEKQVAKLYESALLYKRLKVSFKPETSQDFVAELKAFKPAIAPGVAAIRAQQAGKE